MFTKWHSCLIVVLPCMLPRPTPLLAEPSRYPSDGGALSALRRARGLRQGRERSVAARHATAVVLHAGASTYLTTCVTFPSCARGPRRARFSTAAAGHHPGGPHPLTSCPKNASFAIPTIKPTSTTPVNPFSSRKSDWGSAISSGGRQRRPRGGQQLARRAGTACRAVSGKSHGPGGKVASTTRLPLSVTTGPAFAAPPIRKATAPAGDLPAKRQTLSWGQWLCTGHRVGVDECIHPAQGGHHVTCREGHDLYRHALRPQLRNRVGSVVGKEYCQTLERA